MTEIKKGFEPVFNAESRLLVLGSFPSVKSRSTDFYYGNKQNRFWRTVCGYFGESAPETIEEKRQFLLRRKIALWDIVTECEIVASRDATIKNYRVAELEKVLQKSAIEFIIVNGGKAFEIFKANYGDIDIPYIRLPSTSPANVLFSEEVWHDALSRVFGGT